MTSYRGTGLTVPVMHTAHVAAQAGVNPRTPRYGPDAVRIVRFIKRAHELGYDLDQVQLLLELARGGPDDPRMARRLTAATISDLEGRIATLVAMRTCLERLVATCSRPPRERECPLLEALP